MIKRVLYIIFIIFVLSGCKQDNIITAFDPIVTNGRKTEKLQDKTIVQMDFDMTNSVFEGLSLPSKDSVFEFTFTIDNKENKKYYYKIFWQNISYAFEDSHPLSYENFYGSWEDTDTEFKLVKTNTVKDSFKIVSNPRNERKYFGDDFPNQYTDKTIEDGFRVINADKQWYEVIKKKAEENNVPLKEQMYKDLMWNMENTRNQQGATNRRERRNARVGNYEFMLVVAEEQALKQIPEYIKNIAKTKDSLFVNPFDYFLNKDGKKIKGVYTVVSSKQLKARARFDVSKGVYINRAAYPYYDFKVFPDNNKVGNTDSLYRYAQFEEYYHNINTARYIKQVQTIADYDTLAEFSLQIPYPTLNIHPFITNYPGKNIRCNGSAIEFFNPANTDIKTAKKENVGIKGRVGFTYGKFIYKIKFPEMLNKNGIWNGLTNAAWLVFQNTAEWNSRRESKKGYVKENYNENETQRVNKTNYSEIDIEMIKTSPYWPAQNKEKPMAKEIRNNHKFVFAATNWDLADADNDFIKKNMLFEKQYKDKTFTYNRWNENSRNLTSRVEVSADIFSEPFYYYVIEWKPTEIIWYIGKDLEHLTVVGYMSDEFTSIPNNQMVPVITQEYHYSEYWPPIIFEQGLLPYSSKDTKGVLYELIVE